MIKKEIEAPIKDITFVCPKCGKPVAWYTIELTNGSSISSFDWECKYCGGEVLKISASRRGYIMEE